MFQAFNEGAFRLSLSDYAMKFSYAADGETFYEMPVAEATAESASGTCGYTGTLTANNGYLRVVTPGGVSNALPCAFNA